MGLTEVPVHVAQDLTPAQIKAYRIADNQTGNIATWDFDLLPLELADLQGMEFDLDLLGFDARRTGCKLLSPDGPRRPVRSGRRPRTAGRSDDAARRSVDPRRPSSALRRQFLGGRPRPPAGRSADPPLQHRSAVQREGRAAQQQRDQRGAEFVLGPRRQTQDGHAPSGTWTWPGIPEKAKPTGKKLRAKDRPLANDFVTDEEFDRLLDAWFGNIARVLLPGRAAYIWGGYANCANYPPYLKKHGLYFSQAIIWDKQHPVLTRKDFMGAHEWCFYAWKEGAAHKFYGPNNATDLWHDQEDPAAADGASDGQAGGTRSAGDAVLDACPERTCSTCSAARARR